jgi:hypothetical protein
MDGPSVAPVHAGVTPSGGPHRWMATGATAPVVVSQNPAYRPTHHRHTDLAGLSRSDHRIASPRVPPNLVGIALTITEPLPFAGDADDPED